MGMRPAIGEEVWVITDSTRAVTGMHHPARYTHLDAAKIIEGEFSNLPSAPQQAAHIARRRLEDGGLALQERMRAAYQGITDAWSLGIIKVPAVVVDQRYVVYGEYDLDRALARIRQYRREQP